MHLWHAIVLGIVEGITEFLPISSTGHMLLAARLLSLPQTTAQETFEIVIQLGAILAVVVLYAKTLIRSQAIMLRVFVAFLPTAVIGLLLHGIVKKYLLASNSLVLWTLLIGGVILIVFEAWYREGPRALDAIERMTYKQALLIGVFQSLAIVPGVSRSAATIVGGMLLGIRRRTIVDFSFLLAIPTMLAATGYDLFKSHAALASGDWLNIAVGTVVSFIVAIVAIRWMLHYIQNHSFTAFGIERIVVALLFFVF